MDNDKVQAILRAFNCKLQPRDLGDDGIAFLSFLSWASGSTDMARAIQAAYFTQTGRLPRHDSRATADETGQYIDWLIERHWGEAALTKGVH